MKTTIDLPDETVRLAKVLAAERRTTLRALVLEGLECVLEEKPAVARNRSRLLFAEMDKLPRLAARHRFSRAQAHAR